MNELYLFLLIFLPAFGAALFMIIRKPRKQRIDLKSTLIASAIIIIVILITILGVNFLFKHLTDYILGLSDPWGSIAKVIVYLIVAVIVIRRLWNKLLSVL